MRYLLMVQLDPKSDNARVARDVAAIMEVLRRHTAGDQEFAYKSQYGHVFGVAFRFDGDKAKMFSQMTGGKHFLADDAAVIVEVGDLIAGRGASRFWTWLQHHQ